MNGHPITIILSVVLFSSFSIYAQRPSLENVEFQNKNTEIPSAYRHLLNEGKIEIFYKEFGRNYRNERYDDNKKFKVCQLYDDQTESYQLVDWYHGEVVEGKANGFGIGIFKNGSVYMGFANRGKLEGFGRFLIPFKINSIITRTEGKYGNYVRSTIIEGMFYNNKLNGEGLMRTKMGESFYKVGSSYRFRQYLVVIGKFRDGRLGDKGIGYIADKELLSNFAADGYICTSYPDVLFDCFNEKVAKRELQQQMAAAAAVGIVAYFFKSTLDSWRESLTSSNYNSQENTISSAHCYTEEEWKDPKLTDLATNLKKSRKIICNKNGYTSTIKLTKENKYEVPTTLFFKTFDSYSKALNYILEDQLYCNCN